MVRNPLANQVQRWRRAAAQVIGGGEALRTAATQHINEVRDELREELERRTQDLMRREDTVLASYDRRVAALVNRVLNLEEQLRSERPHDPRVVDGSQVLAAHAGAGALGLDARLRAELDHCPGARQLLVGHGEEVVAVFRDCAPVLDLACGRGELLTLLHAAGVAASGVGASPSAASALRHAGIDARVGDPFLELAGRPAGSLGAVAAFQLVEHLETADVHRLLHAGRHAVRSHGLVVVATTYPESETSISAFWQDPTRVRPYHPAAIQSLATHAGLEVVEVRRYSPEHDHYLLVGRRP